MKIDKLIFKDKKWTIFGEQECIQKSVNIVFVFGHIGTLQSYNHTALLKTIYPNSHIVGISTAGNILDSSIDSYKAVASAVSFERGYIKVSSKKMNLEKLSQDGSALVESLTKNNLKHILLLAPGLINGSELLQEISLDKNTTISGGLAGDENRFENTFLFLDEENGDNLAIAVGFYGSGIHARVGCKNGWREVGASRVVTKSFKNIVYELDNIPILKLYELYLGDKIDAIPNSLLRYPLSVKNKIDDKNEVIRVLMKINEDKSFVFAGDIKEGSIVRLMKTNVPNILDGAFLSAKKILPYNDKRSLGLTISCAARQGVLKQLSSAEIEIVQDILTSSTQIIGFYSYGEIAPFSNELSKPILHNQTMTITTIYED